MSKPKLCRKALMQIAIFAFGLSFSMYASAITSNALLPRSDLLTLVATPAPPSLLQRAIGELPAVADSANKVTSPSKAKTAADPVNSLVALAMELRDIRYRRGGGSPSSGFDCSGFVSYVFLHSLGLSLPRSSAAQFVTGLKVARNEMRSGDLVFFRTAGKTRISHVGIYLDDGRFIHAPSAGKSVRIDSLSEAYWSKRFAGAKRPEGIALG